MKKLTTIFAFTFCFCLCADSPSWDDVQKLTSWQKMQRPLFTALQKAGKNSPELIKLIKEREDEAEKRAAVFLVSYMPERDLMQLSADFLAENIKYAFKARKQFSWCQKLPEEVFFNDVLPYAVLNERRDNWRKDFFDRFAPMVRDCKTEKEAAEVIRKNVMKNVGVKYSTKRKKADQSPYESMESGLASCSGISIIHTDAFRAVGIASRIAGIPAWVNKNGNHTWNETLIDGEWIFTEKWILADVVYADETKWQHRIYATSFAPEIHWFPLVWDLNIRFVHGLDRTAHYREKGLASMKIREDRQTVAVVVVNGTGERVATDIKVSHNGQRITEGKTRGPEADMNNMLQFPLKVGQEYTVSVNNPNQPLMRKFKVVKNDKVQVITLKL